MLVYILLVLLSSLGIFLLGRKWEIEPRYYLCWMAAMALAECATVAAVLQLHPTTSPWPLVLLGLFQTGLLSLLTILFFFFRDPERRAPVDPSLVVSPADGRIVYIREIDDGRFPFAVKGCHTIPLREFSHADFVPDRGMQIGIAMNFLNVHVNRSPISGKVQMVTRIPGKFASLKHIASLLENERMLMVTEGAGLRIGIVQIASRLVRRIVPYVQEGQDVDQGQRVGMIRFGSQVDVLIPYREDLEILVTDGQEVRAGESVLARLAEIEGT